MAEVDARNKELTTKMEGYDDIRKVLQELGWADPDKDRWLDGRRVRWKVEEIQRVLPIGLLKRLEQAGQAANVTPQLIRLAVQTVASGGEGAGDNSTDPSGPR